jgi:UDP-N-acetylglucosamine 2-epimerase (non-hydrolysing)
MMRSAKNVLAVAGARPNFMKIAPIVKHAASVPRLALTLVHTGQHYDEKLSKVFFDELNIPKPDVNLEVGSGSHAQQTAAIMAAFEPVLLERRADMVLVVGDVNSTIACALVASKLGVKVVHVEAGLRSFDREMPEEINRVLTDQISDVLFTTEEAAAINLAREGIAAHKVHFCGNVMIDTLLAHRERAKSLGAPARYGLSARNYGLLTLHRPSNVDDAETLESLLTGIAAVATDVPLLFPVHPRTRPMIARSATARGMVERGQLRTLDPLGYLEFIGLMDDSRVVLTDSGGIQEETTILGVPCLTLRHNTERPVTVTHGTNRIVGTDAGKIRDAWKDVRGGNFEKKTPPLWDGHAAERIVQVLGNL